MGFDSPVGLQRSSHQNLSLTLGLSSLALAFSKSISALSDAYRTTVVSGFALALNVELNNDQGQWRHQFLHLYNSSQLIEA